MEYRELAKLFYRDSSSDREGNLAAEEMRRRNSVGTFQVDYETEAGKLFLAVPKELSTLTEKVLRTERKVTVLLNKMNPLAANAVLRGLVFDEVVFTNAIEGIHSTRRQIKDALEAVSGSVSRRRFKELALLYMGIVSDKAKNPATPKDVRAIYDKVMDGELDDAHMPDGELFRKDGVDVVAGGTSVIHRGLEPENRIVRAMESMLALTENDGLPSLYASLISHYLFEYAHPFYDGNGRTGRYLCSLMLSRSLSKPTVLSLSRVILENREQYYKAFRSVENPLNKGELTFFVVAMMELVRKAQLDVIDRLDLALRRQDELRELMKVIDSQIDLKRQESEIVFMLMQYETFGMFGDVSVDEVSAHLQVGTQAARKHLRALEDKGFAVKVNQRRPMTFGLSRSLREEYGIEPVVWHSSIE